MVKTFSKNYLEDELELPFDALEETLASNDDGVLTFEIIFKDGDEHYITWYSRNAEEYRNEVHWANADETICVRVHKVPKVVEVWEEY